MISDIESSHVSTEEHLARPPGWDPLKFPQYDSLFRRLGHNIKRITTKTRIPQNPRNFKRVTPATFRTRIHKRPTPSKTIRMRDKDYNTVSNNEFKRRENRE